MRVGIDPLPVESTSIPARRTAHRTVVRPTSNGNVWLPRRRGKLDDFLYNPLQVKEFRI